MTREQDYEKLHRSPQVKAQALSLLATLAEQYPMLRLGQILCNATSADLYNVEDDELARALDQLRITYAQFKAAGIKKEQIK